jgi:GNAT superfamily N-acetyltransferase
MLFGNKRTFPAFCDENAHLWFDGFGALVGFVINESGDSDFAILTLDGSRFLYPEMLDWAVHNWGSRQPPIHTEVTEDQDLEMKALEHCGFKLQSTFYTRGFDLTGELLPRPSLQEGFAVVDMASNPDYRNQGNLRANGFHGSDDLNDAEMEERMRMTYYTLGDPIYHAPTDICVMAPDGRFVAGCEALIDVQNAEADIERVCTHNAYRKRGFARAAILECFHRLKDMGIRKAYITGYSPAAIALYGSLGAVEEKKAYTYELTQSIG